VLRDLATLTILHETVIIVTVRTRYLVVQKKVKIYITKIAFPELVKEDLARIQESREESATQGTK
jgi:hypothetical protein